MQAVNWSFVAKAEAEKIIRESFGNPNLPELLWLKGYVQGMKDTVGDLQESEKRFVSTFLDAITREANDEG